MRTKRNFAASWNRQGTRSGKQSGRNGRIADIDSRSNRCHTTDEMEERFRTGRAVLAGNFWKRNGLDSTSKEEDILHCIVKEMDRIANDDFKNDRERMLASFRANQEQLMELAAAYGELIVREIGGSWSVG